jgi:signal transduction histidine kinase
VRANKQKSRFLAVVSHELKKPLTAICGFSHLLARSKLNPRESHNKTVNIQSTQPAKLITNYLSIHLPQFEKKAPTVHHNISPLVTLQSDQSMLSTLLSNLLSNAVKYNKQGEY